MGQVMAEVDQSRPQALDAARAEVIGRRTENLDRLQRGVVSLPRFIAVEQPQQDAPVVVTRRGRDCPIRDRDRVVDLPLRQVERAVGQGEPPVVRYGRNHGPRTEADERSCRDAGQTEDVLPALDRYVELGRVCLERSGQGRDLFHRGSESSIGGWRCAVPAPVVA